MNVTKVGEVFKVAKISGPKHNFLGMIVSEKPLNEVAMVPFTKDNEKSVIDESRLFAAVSEGIELENLERGTRLFAHRIEYVTSDTPVYRIYTELARAIIVAAVEQ